MFRILYIFVVLHIMRGCPKVMSIVDHNPARDTASSPNSTSPRSAQESFPVDDQRLGGQNVYSAARLSKYGQSVDTIFTALAPLRASTSLQGENYFRAILVIADLVTIMSKYKFVFLGAAVIGLCIGIPIIILAEYSTVFPNTMTGNSVSNKKPELIVDEHSSF
ncbi:hypothetical protein AAHC03_04492 [Spirometra sp. Aus1]